jgi:hypothetical protein
MSDKIKESHPIGPEEINIQNLEDMKVIIPNEYGVYEWHSEKDGKGKPEAVALAFKIGEYQLTIRLKSRGEVLRLIKILERHMNNIWPESS